MSRLIGHGLVILAVGLVLAPLYVVRAFLAPLTELVIRLTDALADVLSERLRA